MANGEQIRAIEGRVKTLEVLASAADDWDSEEKMRREVLRKFVLFLRGSPILLKRVGYSQEAY
jgi:hypothetical protein